MAYATKYRLPFYDFDNNSCYIDFQYDDYAGDVLELTGARDVLTISYRSDDFLYAPSRFAGATINLVVQGYITDLYATGYQDVRVLIFKDNQFIFCGFLTPEIYSQNNNGGLTRLTLEAISALAVLQYIPYVPPVGIYTQTLQSLIHDALVAAKGVYTSVFYPENWDATLESMFVSTANFIDEEENPVTYRDVLEWICTFMGLTMTEKKNNIYFVDVDFVKKRRNSYVQYDGYMNDPAGVAMSTDLQQVSDDESKGSDNTMTILPAFNKATVIASDYEVKPEELFKPFDGADRGNMRRDLNEDTSFTDGDGNNFEYANAYYNDNNYSYFKYIEAGNDLVLYQASDDSNSLLFYAGAQLCIATSYPVDDLPKSLSYTDMVRIRLSQNGGTLNLETLSAANPNKYKMFYWESKKAFSFIENGYLSVNFSAFFSTVNQFPITQRDKSGEQQVTEDDSPIAILPIMIQCGDRYYSDATRDWTSTTPLFFYITILANRNEYIYDTWHNCEDNFNFTFGTKNLTGFAVKVPSAMQGDLKLTVFVPTMILPSQDETPKYMFIRDLKIEYESGSFRRIGTSGYEDKDTTYSNVINESAVNEAPDITFKLTSKNKTACSKSKVYDNFGMIDTIMTDTHGETKPEVLAIQRVTGQYSRPTFKLQEVTVPKLDPLRIIQMTYAPDKAFLLAGEEIDVQMNRSKVTLLELV